MNRLVSVFLAGMLFLTTGCATTNPPVKMTPYLDYSTFTATGKSIRVAAVRVGEVQTPAESLQITGESYRNSLKETLVKTGIFRVLAEGENADYECQAEIVSQKVFPGLTANAILFVHYRVVDVRTKNVVFKSSVHSQKDAYGGDLTNTLESAARENLTKIVSQISARTW
jgi:curli biogenesis system outer membrane secretion channel CsgG